MAGWQNSLFNWIENARLTLANFVLLPRDRQRAQHLQQHDRWFYRAEWQSMEREAEADVREGRYEDFKDIGELISVLKQNSLSESQSSVSGFDRIAAALRRTARRRWGRANRRSQS